MLKKEYREEIFIHTILNRISIAVIVIVVASFLVDKSILGVNVIGIIPLICLVLVTSYIGKLEKKAGIDKKVKTISWICFLQL